MKDSFIPKTYEEWHRYITVEGGIDLTPDYISQRITALQDEKEHSTQQFSKQYGQEYLQQVISWFKQAQTAESAATK